MLIVIVTLRSLPQSFEQVVLTEFPPTSNGAKYIKKQKLLQDIQDPPLTTSGCQRKLPISTSQYGQWRSFVMII